MEKNINKLVKEGVKEVLEFDVAQQRTDYGYGWIYLAFYDGTKDAIKEAIAEGKLKLK